MAGIPLFSRRLARRDFFVAARRVNFPREPPQHGCYCVTAGWGETEVPVDVSSRRLALVLHRHLAEHGLLSFLSLLGAFLLNVIKRNQDKTAKCGQKCGFPWIFACLLRKTGKNQPGAPLVMIVIKGTFNREFFVSAPQNFVVFTGAGDGRRSFFLPAVRAKREIPADDDELNTSPPTPCQ